MTDQPRTSKYHIECAIAAQEAGHKNLTTQHLVTEAFMAIQQEGEITRLRAENERLREVWQPISTAPKDDDKHIWLASFVPGETIPKYIVQAIWGVVMPGYMHCASYSGWFVDLPLIADPSRFRGGRAEQGIIYEDGASGPTHWMYPVAPIGSDVVSAGPLSVSDLIAEITDLRAENARLREPTDEMIEAGEEEIACRRNFGCEIYAADVYAAMIAKSSYNHEAEVMTMNPENSLAPSDNSEATGATVMKAEIDHLRTENEQLRSLINDFVCEGDDCEFDHHGYCQAHSWFEIEQQCPHARAKEILAATDQNIGGE